MIVYALIARANDGSVLAECSAPGIEGNYPTVSQELIKILSDRRALVPVGNHKSFAHQSSTGKRSSMAGVGGCDPLKPMWEKFDEMLGVDNGNAASKEILHHFFHVYHGEGAFYMCLSDDSIARRQNV